MLPSEPPGKPRNTGVGSLSSRSSCLRNQTGVSCIAGRFFTSRATRKAEENLCARNEWPEEEPLSLSQTRNRTQVSCIAGGFFNSWATREALPFSSFQSLSHVRLFATPWIAACQASLFITTSGVYPNPCPSSWWCHPAISSSIVPFSSCPQSLPASGSFPMSQLFAWGGQSIGVWASTSVLPMNTQDWSPLGWTGWISLQSKGLSRVFSNITVQKHQFFSTQLSSPSNSHIHTWLLEKP